MSEPMTPSMRRCDLAPAAVVFGGLLVVLAIGGTLDLAPQASRLNEEIKVVAGEALHGADDLDPVAACKKLTKSVGVKSAELVRRCRQTALNAAH